MTDSVSTTRRVPSPLFRKEKRKEWILISALALLFILVLLLISVIIEQSTILSEKEEGIYRTNNDLINGGKRFIDYFYSVDSATVQYDQFRAIEMIIDPILAKERKRYLRVNDVVRKVKEASMDSAIDWTSTSNKIVEETGNYLKVEYRGYIRTDDRIAGQFNIILFLVPVKKTDLNTDGVGVLRWIDVAEKPFKEGDNNENL